MKLTNTLFTVAVAALSLTACGTKNTNADLEIENKVEALLGKMTLEEKLGQMNQLSPWDFNELAGKVRKGEVGSILNYTDSALVNKIQRGAQKVHQQANTVRRCIEIV